MKKIQAPRLTSLTGWLGLVAALLLVLTSYAAPDKFETPTQVQNKPAASAGLINDYLRQQNPSAAKWDIGGEDRLRAESRQGMAIAGVSGSVDFRDHGADVNNSYLLNRFRLHIGYTEKWWSIYAEAQSSTAYNDERFAYANVPAVAGTAKRKGAGPEADNIDLHQAYLTLGNLKEFPVSLKLGRQELSYGEERLVGAFGWNNIARVFDAAKVRWQNDWFGADFFTSHVVIPEDGRFDVDNGFDWFSGVYATSAKIVPKNTLDLYFLARNSSRSAVSEEPSPQFPQPTARDIYTVGGRLKSKPGEFGGFDYTLEGAYQFGSFAPAATAARLTQDAYMFVAQAGYTFTNVWSAPRLGVEYAFASGDSNAGDDKHGTFENLFPTNHKFYGYMDFVSLQNIHDVRGTLTLKPTPKLNIAIEGHGFWLADTHDTFYNVGGGARTTGGYGANAGYNSFVGTELDVVATYALPRNAKLEAGYGHFFTGDYVNQSLAGVGGATDANWFYAQLTLTF
ncbi:MAG: alginate export family protein [Verrucomicrobia bacterium]|nr:alginate export family protein [Verrucomicrobiota bacterium]